RAIPSASAAAVVFPCFTTASSAACATALDSFSCAISTPCACALECLLHRYLPKVAVDAVAVNRSFRYRVPYTDRGLFTSLLLAGGAYPLDHLRPQLSVPGIAVVEDVPAGLVQVQPERGLLLEEHHPVPSGVPVVFISLPGVQACGDLAFLEMRQDTGRVGGP